MTEGRSRAKVSLGAAITAAVGILLVANGVWVGRNCERLRAPRSGMAAPDFSLEGIDGRRVSLGSLRGKVVLLDFWAIWCRPCIAKFPFLESLAAEHEAAGLRVLAVNVERSATSIRNLSRRRKRARDQQGLSASRLTYLLGDGRASFAFGVQSLPHVVIVGRDGRVVFQHRGGGGRDALRQHLLKALAEERR